VKRRAPALAACFAWLLAGCGASESSPNVLVLVPDTVRADHLSVYGYGRDTSPALAKLAREGTLFLDAVTVAPRTWQSFVSILTGLYPPHHGVRYLYDHPIRAETPTIASAFRDHGYEAVAFDTLPFVRAMTGGKGFATYLEERRPRDPSLRDETLLDRLHAHISRPRSEPFLAFVRLTGAHWPYTNRDWIDPADACASHDHGFNRGSPGISLRSRGEGFGVSDEGSYRKHLWKADFDDATRRHMVAHYDSAVRQTDFLIGRLLDRMRESGLLERTIVVVTSDHGESFGEHGYLQHGPRVDETVMRVPLLLRLPHDHPASRPGSVVEALVRVTDVFPTLLDAAGLPPQPGLDGASLLPLIDDPKPHPAWGYGESGRSFQGIDPERHFPGVRGKHRMIRTGAWKLVVVPTPEGDERRLYDLRRDPGETRDVAAAHPAVVRDLTARLGDLRDVESKDRPERSLAPGERALLKDLGYLE